MHICPAYDGLTHKVTLSDENGEVFDNSFTVCSYDDFEELADYLNEQAANILDDYDELSA